MVWTSSSCPHSLGEQGDLIEYLFVALHETFHFVDGVDDGGVIATTELGADLW